LDINQNETRISEVAAIVIERLLEKTATCYPGLQAAPSHPQEGLRL
jgi:hypothetical protein